MSLYNQLMALSKVKRDQLLSDANERSERDIESRYDDMLDDVYPDLKIAGHEYSTSHALKLIDSVAYREGFLNFTDADESIIEINDSYYDVEEIETLLEKME